MQPTWEEQEEYLRTKKIGNYFEHYYNLFDRGVLLESWAMSGDDVLKLLLPKLDKKFPTVLTKKDPRLSAGISNTEIKKYGRRVI